MGRDDMERRAMTAPSRANLSWLTVVKDGEDDFVIGNGSSFVNVPEVGVELIKLLNGSRSIAQAGHVLGERLGTEVDALDFVQTLSDMAILDL
jgi:putative peptide zinc metalloprotease protein